MKKLFFDDFDPENPGKSALSVLVRNRSGVVELVGREPLIFARVERRDKIFAEKTEIAKILDQKNSFQWGIFNFLADGKLKLTFFLGGGITSKLASQ